MDISKQDILDTYEWFLTYTPYPRDKDSNSEEAALLVLAYYTAKVNGNASNSKA